MAMLMETGLVFLHRKNESSSTVLWSSKQLSVVTLSLSDAKYFTLSHATQERIWSRSLLKNIGLTQEKPTIMFEDNQGAISLNPKSHWRKKQINIYYRHIREAAENQKIQHEYCHTKEMTAWA